MNIAGYRDEVRLKLTGNLVELELDDATLDRIINASLREIQRYISTTKLITTSFSRCIDLNKLKDEGGKKIKVNSVVKVYRTQAVANDDYYSSAEIDPAYASQWQLLSGTGNLANFQNYIYDYAAWNTISQIRNTTSTDLAYKYDKSDNKLYINSSTGSPTRVTIEYVPRYDNVKEIESDYWVDNLVLMSVAQTKIIVGRIRSKYKQNNALWDNDGATILAEGLEEYKALQQHLIENSMLCYGID